MSPASLTPRDDALAHPPLPVPVPVPPAAAHGRLWHQLTMELTSFTSDPKCSRGDNFLQVPPLLRCAPGARAPPAHRLRTTARLLRSTNSS